MYVERNSWWDASHQGGRNLILNQNEFIDKAWLTRDSGISVLVLAAENHSNF